MLVDNKLLEEERTFSSYFKLKYSARDIAEYFSYKFIKSEELNWKKVKIDISFLQSRLSVNERYIDRDSEIAIREFVIAPILMELINIKPFHIYPERYVEIQHNLKGYLDYLIETEDQDLLVIEAKEHNLSAGIKQIVAQLIAIDKAVEKDKLVTGVLTIGRTWILFRIDRATKTIYQDFREYSLPSDLELLVSILNGIIHSQKD